MRVERRIVTSIFFGWAAVAQAADRGGHTNDQVVAALQPWSAAAREITCKAAYDRRVHDGYLGPVTEAQSTKSLTVDGIVLSILQPAQFKGKLVTFHFDFPEDSNHWYLPDFLYRGQVRTGYIGTLAFMCDPGCFVPVTDPLPSANPQALKQLLRHRVWSNRFAAALKEQFGDKALFDTLYSFLTDTNMAPNAYADQKTAAELLARFQPACNVSVERAISETLSTWDESVGEWPLYLWRSFGREKVLHALERVQAGRLPEAQRETTEVWRYWLSGDQKDLPEKP